MLDLLINAKSEIEQLRRRNEILAAKVDTMELFACVLHTQPASISIGQSEDIAYQLQQEIEELMKKERNTP
jgi:hypothetical protein